MTAVNLERISKFDAISLITQSGDVLHSYPIDMANGLSENFIISTEEFRLPTDSFYIELSGTDSGNFKSSKVYYS